MIYTTLYNPAIDLLYRVDDLSVNNTFTNLKSQTVPAGKGLNVAKVIRQLGEEAAVLAIMPEEDLSRFHHSASDFDVEFHPFKVPGHVRINTTIVEDSSGLVQHYNSQGNPFSTQVQDEFETFISSFMKSGDFWAFSGSLPEGMDRDAYARIIETCHKKGVSTALDSSGVALKYGVWAKPTIITPNENELEQLFEEPVQGIQHIVYKGKRLIEMGVPSVFITLGEDGVIALTKEHCYLCAPPEVKEIDTVGCGDAFLAGVLVAMERGFSFREVCRLAVATGASAAMHYGPGLIDEDQVWHFMEQVKVTEL